MFTKRSPNCAQISGNSCQTMTSCDGCWSNCLTTTQEWWWGGGMWVFSLCMPVHACQFFVGGLSSYWFWCHTCALHAEISSTRCYPFDFCLRLMRRWPYCRWAGLCVWPDTLLKIPKWRIEMLLKNHWLLCNLSVIHMVHVFDGETPGIYWKSSWKKMCFVLLYTLNLKLWQKHTRLWMSCSVQGGSRLIRTIMTDKSGCHSAACKQVSLLNTEADPAGGLFAVYEFPDVSLYVGLNIFLRKTTLLSLRTALDCWHS